MSEISGLVSLSLTAYLTQKTFSLQSNIHANILNYKSWASSQVKVVPRLLLLLSHFSRVWLCATPWTAAHQAPPSMGFSRREYWSGGHCLLRPPRLGTTQSIVGEAAALVPPESLLEILNAGPSPAQLNWVVHTPILIWEALVCGQVTDETFGMQVWSQVTS